MTSRRVRRAQESRQRAALRKAKKAKTTLKPDRTTGLAILNELGDKLDDLVGDWRALTELQERDPTNDYERQLVYGCVNVILGLVASRAHIEGYDEQGRTLDVEADEG